MVVSISQQPTAIFPNSGENFIIIRYGFLLDLKTLLLMEILRGGMLCYATCRNGILTQQVRLAFLNALLKILGENKDVMA